MHESPHPLASSKARYEGPGRVRFAPNAQKRLNPETGQPWRRGDARPDGLRFACYHKDRDCDEDGFFKEYWVGERGWAKLMAKCHRANQGRYLRGRSVILEAKKNGCVDCGYNAHPAALDFDHLPGTDKKFELALGHSRSVAAIKRELAKCECVCANCHRVRTFNRKPAKSEDIWSVA
jgi:hypothetical protein